MPKGIYQRESPKDRFDKKWTRESLNNVRTATACWRWKASFFIKGGYGLFRFDGRAQYAHRVAWVLYRNDPLPPFKHGGLQCDHLCRNRWCVNPFHLELVSSRENTHRGKGQAALNALKTHCLQGHPFSETNTYRWNNIRSCRICKIAHRTKYNEKKRHHG